ncbi:MAG TPA: BTAD domain-containing putative transcriptional regulator [Jatrophihabitantaceae bacterium]
MSGERLGARLRRLRVAAGLTQHEAAGRADLSVGALRDLEQGRTAAPRKASLSALAHALGVEPVELVGERAKAIEVNILGPLELIIDGAPGAVGGHKQAVLTGLLALHANEYVSREELAEYLWPDRRPTDYAGLLHSYIARLRRRLRTEQGPAATITSSRQRYRLTIPSECVDASTVASGAPGSFEQYDAALRSWRGRVLDDLVELQHHPRVVALEQRRALLVIEFADAALTSEHAEQAIPIVDALAALEPLHEGVAARRIQLLAAAGRLSDAHAVFSTTRRLLVDELGVEPGVALLDTYRDVLDRDAPIESARTAVTTGPQRGLAPAQLPGGVPDFIGRSDEITRLRDYLGADAGDGHGPTVAAVTGTGGLGKTTLAVHVAHQIKSRFPDGQLFVDLRGVGGRPAPVEQVLEQFLVSLGHARTALPERVDELAALYRSATARGRFLIVLDNARDTEQVEPLLPGTDGCAVIVTSRRFLTDLDGALHVRVATLGEDESVALLRSVLGADPVDRHRGDAEQVVALCSGFPLALRLAASQVAVNPSWGLDELRERLERTNGRLDLLRSSHRAVEACFELSYRDLPDEVARAFRLLSLSDGPDISLDAAAAITDQPPDRVRRALDHLVEHSMLVARRDDRFAYHDLMRFFARQCADEQDTAAARHDALERLAGWYLSFGRRATLTAIPHRVTPPVDGIVADAPADRFPSAQAASAWLEAERANLIVTVGQAAAAGMHTLAWLLADAASGVFRQRQQSHEWISTANVGLGAAEQAGDPHGLVMMHECLARGYASRADQRAATHHYQEALQVATSLNWPEAEISIRENLGNAYQEIGEMTEARAAFVRALQLSRETGQPFWEAACLNDLGTNERIGRGDLGAAERYYHQALMLNERLPGGQPNVNLGNLGIVAHLRGAYEQAWDYMQAALRLDEQASNPALLGETYVTLSMTALALDRAEDAAHYAREALALSQTIDDAQLFARALVSSGMVQLASGSPLVATQQLERALDVSRHGQVPAAELEALLALAAHADAGGDLDREVEFAEQARVLATRLGDRIAEGKALHQLAAVAQHQGNRLDAIEHARAARGLFARSGHRPGLVAVDALLATLDRAPVGAAAAAGGTPP